MRCFRPLASVAFIAVVGAICSGLHAARAGDEPQTRPPTQVDLRLRLEPGAVYEFTYRETAECERENDPQHGHSLSGGSTWTLRAEVKRTQEGGSVEFEFTWTEIDGRLTTAWGTEEFLVKEGAEHSGITQPSNSRGGRLANSVGRPSLVTVSALGEVTKIEGPARGLLDGQDNPVADAELAVLFQRLFARLPETTIRSGGTWESERVVAPEFVDIIDMTAYGTLTEKSKVTKLTAERALVSVSSKGKARKHKGGDDEPPAPKGRKPTHPVGELVSWKVSAEAEIDHRTGLLMSRTESLTAVSRMRYSTGLAPEATLTSTAQVTCRALFPDEK